MESMHETMNGDSWSGVAVSGLWGMEAEAAVTMVEVGEG